MNRFYKDRWLGSFVTLFALITALGLWSLFSAKADFERACSEFRDAVAERNRLEHLKPFPNEENFHKTQNELEECAVALNRLKEELKLNVPAVAPLAPNEFQSRLRQAIIATIERASANRVKLPDNFHLGFDEFTTTLPNTEAAPLLGQELALTELLAAIVIDARVDAIVSLKLASSASERPETVPPLKAGPAIERQCMNGTVVDLAFTASPSALRKAMNQIASSQDAFFIVRTLDVRNEQQKPPSREETVGPSRTKAAAGGIKFIVGNEHVETGARIEMVRFTF